jgi:hypothetical protein
MKYFIPIIAVFLAVAVCPVHADEFDTILSDMAETRASHIGFIDTLDEVLKATNRLKTVCTVSEKVYVIEPLVNDIIYLKEFSNTIISSIDEYTKLYNSVTASRNNADRNSLIHVYEMYRATFLYWGKQSLELEDYLEEAVKLSDHYGIQF